MAILFIFIIAIFCIFQFVNSAGITAFIMYKDYRNCDFSYYSGEIDKVENSKSMSDGGVIIGGYKFLASLEMQKELRDYTGTECEIVYATKSKYIVDIILN